jgi:L-threonylcarbamoyladenylate synthase
MAAEVVAHFEPLAERLAARFWPGPLTLVLPAAAGLAHALTAGSDTIGIRVPGSEVARELSRSAGGCIVSTSANLSGGAPVTTSAALDPALVAQLDGVLDGGPTPGGLASTVLAVRDGQLTLLRPGAIAWEALLPFAAPAGTLQGRGG